MEEGIVTPEVAPVNTPPADGVVDSWFGGFPDELKGNELITGHDGPESMAKAYLETNTKYNELQTSLPTPPESPDAYQFDIPTDIEVDQARIDGFKQFAFERKIPVDVAKDLVAEQLKYEKTAQERATEEFNSQVKKTEEDTLEALKREKGAGWQVFLDGAKQVTTRFVDEADKKYLEDSGYGNDAVLIKIFGNIKSVLSESVFVAGEPASKGSPKDSFGRDSLEFPSMQT